MIYGIGADIVEIGRIRDAAEKWGERFFKKIFTDNELSYCYKKKNPYPHLSARFAAKEAFIKASSSLRSRRMSFSEIEILNEPSGRPLMRINAPDLKFHAPDFLVHLTLTHEQNYAIAMVVLERKNS